ncbi:hypothetical protein ASG89_29935 [Paenibacillus sp. Soil766]|uniref:GDSL-type esterase/lipase family protein n=1 Tax=Paenibacillus sp. Soil766 TaxID=1736404 RepID=UPI0007089D5E|nr:GDSL-type esterase/lipase family protein [Paenibacillus sp. Soil766]KRE97080.1 hypothetical protein ASG89_29935 [Paenibacillus sp. Soil766]
MKAILSILSIIRKKTFKKQNNNLTTTTTPYWQQKVLSFGYLNMFAEEDSIVFLGDSITEQFMNSEYFHSKCILNRGIGGDTTTTMLSRLENTFINIQPEKIFLLIGINDILQNKNMKDILYNYNAIIKSIKSILPLTEIFIQSILPVSRKVGSSSHLYNKKIQQLNVEIMQIAKRSNLEFIDTYSLFKDNDGHLLDMHTFDGIHLNGEGYKMWSGELMKLINQGAERSSPIQDKTKTIEEQLA